MEPEYFTEFHGLFEAIVVECCEGKGIKNDPKRIVYYIFTKNLELLGKIDPRTK